MRNSCQSWWSHPDDVGGLPSNRANRKKEELRGRKRQPNAHCYGLKALPFHDFGFVIVAIKAPPKDFCEHVQRRHDLEGDGEPDEAYVVAFTWLVRVANPPA